MNKVFFIQTLTKKDSVTFRYFRVFQPKMKKGELILVDVSNRISKDTKETWHPHFGLKVPGVGFTFGDWLKDNWDSNMEAQQLFISRDTE